MPSIIAISGTCPIQMKKQKLPIRMKVVLALTRNDFHLLVFSGLDAECCTGKKGCSTFKYALTGPDLR